MRVFTLHTQLLCSVLCFVLLPAGLAAQNGRWIEQPIEVPVRGLMGISMADTGNGYAVGDVDVLRGHSGVLRKRAGEITWKLVPPGVFTPPITIALSSWAQDVHAVPGTGIAFVSWRDDYRSLVYKTVDYGQTWFSVSPLNPILYGTRFRIRFKDAQEGLIVGEGPGRVHRTTDGGRTWTSYTIPTSLPLTDACYAHPYWYVIGGDNVFYRFSSSTQIWTSFSFQQSPEYFAYRITLDFVDKDNGYFTGFNSNSGATLMTTSDGGASWWPVQPGPGFIPNPEGHKGLHFFDREKGWVASAHNELAFTDDGGLSWTSHTATLLGNKTYEPVSKLFFLNESFGWAAGGKQRVDGYPSVSHGYILKWEGDDHPDISTTAALLDFDTLACGSGKHAYVPVRNSGTGLLHVDDTGVRFNTSTLSLAPGQLPLTLSPGEEELLEVRWNPTPGFLGAIPDTVRMYIESNDVDHLPWVLEVRGWRRQAHVVLAASTLQFPSVCLGDTARLAIAADVFGNADPVLVEMSDQLNSGWLQIASPDFGSPVMAGDSIIMYLHTTAGGTISGSMRLMAGDPSCPDTLYLAVSAFVTSNRMTLAPPNLDFGDHCNGSRASEWVRVSNIGNSTGFLREVRHLGGSDAFAVEFDSSSMIDPGSFTLLRVVFRPGVPDTSAVEARKVLYFGPCRDSLVLICRGRSVGAWFDAGMDTLVDLSPIPVGKSVTHELLLRQLGVDVAELQSIELEPPLPGLSLTLDRSLPADVLSGDSIRLTLRYATSTVDSGWTTLCLTWKGACADSLCIPVYVRSEELPAIGVPELFDMGVQQCTGSLIDSLSVRNIGRVPLRVRTLNIAGPDRTHFQVTAPVLAFDIPAEDSAWIHLRYNAPANGVSNAELVLTHNDLSEGGETRIALTAERLVREFLVIGDTTAPLIACPADSVVRVITVRNEHTQPLMLTSLGLDSGAPAFRLDHPAVPDTIEAGEERELRLIYTASGPFTDRAELRLHSEPCATKRVIEFTGRTRPFPLQLARTPVDLGVKMVSEIDTLALWLYNTDTVEVLLQRVALSGSAGVMQLVLAPPAGTRIVPGDSLLVRVRLTGTATAGDIAASLCIETLLPCATQHCAPVLVRFVDEGIRTMPDSLLFVFNDCDTLLCDSVVVVNVLSGTRKLAFHLTDSSNFVLTTPSVVELVSGAAVTVRICATRADVKGRVLVSDARGVVAMIPLQSVYDTTQVVVPGELWCGNVPWCLAGQDVDLQVRNGGLSAATVEVLQPPAAPFSIPGSGMLAVPAGVTGWLPVRFEPGLDGTYSSTMLLRITRGNCERTQQVLLRGRRSDGYLTYAPSALVYNGVVAGTSQLRQLDIRNLDMAGLRLAEILLLPPGAFFPELPLPVSIDSGGVVSLPVRFSPTAAGNYFADLCLVFDQPCADTVCIPVEGVSIEGHLTWDLSSVRFDPLAQCGSDTVRVRLHNSGPASVNLLSSGLTGPSAAAFTVLNPVAGSEPLPSGASREFLLRCAPAGQPDGVLIATLAVTTDDPLQKLAELPLTGTRVTQVTPPGQTVDLGLIVVGVPSQSQVVLRNNGSAALELIAAGLPGTASIAPPPPYNIGAGDSLTLTVTVRADASGAYTDSIRFAIAAPCVDTVTLALRGMAEPGLSVTDLDLGTVPWCSDASGIVVLRNMLPEAWELAEILFDNPSALPLTIVSPPSLPATLPSGGSMELTILLSSSPAMAAGQYNASVVLRLWKSPATIELRSDITVVLADGRLKAVSPLQFGAVQVGSSGQRVLTLRNTSSLPVTIAGLRAPRPPFRVLDVQPPLPQSLLPGDSCTVTLRFTPGAADTMRDTLVAYLDAPCRQEQAIVLEGHGSGDTIPFSISLPHVSGQPDDTLLLPVLLEGAISDVTATSWSGTIAFNHSMLHPLGVVTTGSACEGADATYSFATPEDGMQLQCTGLMTLQPGVPLLYLRMLVLIGNDVHTSLSPREFSFSNPLLHDGLLIDGGFLLDGYCLAGRRVVRRLPGTRLLQGTPNPARDELTVPYELEEGGWVRIVLRDATGREVRVLLDEHRAEGRGEVKVRVHGLPSGAYLCCMEAGGTTYVTKILVMK